MSVSFITKDPDILNNAPVFAGTRVPVKTLIDYLASGESIRDFLDDFPTVTLEQVLPFIVSITIHHRV